MCLLVLVSVVFVGWFLYYVSPYHFWSWKKSIIINKIPGPPTVPLLGNALLFNMPPGELIYAVEKLANNYLGIFRVWFFGHPMVLVTDLDSVEKILSSSQHINKSTDYLILEPWLCTGLLTSTGTKWHERRKILTPAFHFKILEDYINIFNKNSKILVEKLMKDTGAPPVNVSKILTNCTLDIICETAMGTSINAMDGNHTEYVTAVKRMSELFTRRQLTPWLHKPLAFRISPTYYEQQKVLKVLHGFTSKVIKERQTEWRINKIEYARNGSNERKKMSLLDILIELSENGEKLSDLDIREEVDTFMFEGHDTTATLLSWSLFLIGLHPEVQEHAVAEIKEIFEGSDRDPTYEDLQKMKYLEKVIKESLRLYPSVPFFARNSDVDIDVMGFTIPAGTNIGILAHIIHKNPDIFPDPEKFDPERFSPENVQGRHPFAYLPFSAGPRNCIGQKFAMLEEKIIISRLLRTFKIKSVQKRDEVIYLSELILRPKQGIYLSLEKRK